MSYVWAKRLKRRKASLYIGGPVPDPSQSLQQRSLPGTGLHSPSRRPPPGCHPGTRDALRSEITTWLEDKDRQQRALWLFGPAGVGKSAVAQTIGEYAERRGLLGAAVFFSRTRKAGNPARLISTISYQLATKNSDYEWWIAKVIEDDPAALLRDKRTQFKKLLVEPLSTLKQRGNFSKELLIVVDALDECGGDKEQLDLARLIIEDLSSPASLPLLWMICSRPEHHLKALFTDGKLSNLCLERDLSVDEPSAREDVELYLRSELECIAKKYNNLPGSRLTFSVTEKDVKKLVDASSGLFVYGSALLRFIDDPDVADPASRLSLILQFIDGLSDVLGTTNPLRPIDMLYLGVLGMVKITHLSVALKLLGSCTVYPPIPALHLANLLNIDSESFYSSLRRLHSVVAIPLPGEASEKPLHFYHASFPDFLLHPDRSEQYSQDPNQRRSLLLEASFQVLNSTSIAYSRRLSWHPPNSDEEAESPPALSISHDILSFVATHTWGFFTQISNPELELLSSTVVNFDFSRLQSVCDGIPVDQFISFLRWLYVLQKKHPELKNFVHTKPCSDADEKFLKKCRPLLKPLNLESQCDANQLEEAPRYVLVGFKPKTVIVLVIPEAIMIYSVDDIHKL